MPENFSTFYTLKQEILAQTFSAVEAVAFCTLRIGSFSIPSRENAFVFIHASKCVIRIHHRPHVTLGSFSTRGFTHAAITIITGLHASFCGRATDRCPLTLVDFVRFVKLI